MVSGGGCTLKLTAKPKALDGAFGVKIVLPYLNHINKKRLATEQLSLENLESVLVSEPPGRTVASFGISEAAPVVDLSATVRSLVPPGTAGEPLAVELAQRAPRQLKIMCAGVSLSATLPAEHVHLSLHETVVKQFIMNYNDKVNSERPRAKASVTLAEIAEFKLGEATIDIDRPVCQLLPRDGQSMIEMTLTPEAYEKWGYDKPKAASPAKPAGYVFVVRCGVVEFKLTLQEKALAKSIEAGVLTPFLGAYAKKAKRACTIADVLRVEVDGLPVAPSLRVSSVVRRSDAAETAAPKKDDADADAYLAEVEAMKQRGESEGVIAAYSRRYLAASEARDKGQSPTPSSLPASSAPTRVEIFLKPDVARASAEELADSPALATGVSDSGDNVLQTSNPQAVKKPQASKPQAAKPNVDYSKWSSLHDSDEEEEDAAALGKAQQAAQAAQVMADAAASAAIAEAGGDVAAVTDAQRAPVQAKLAAAEEAQARVEAIKQAAATKAVAKAAAEKEAAAAKAAAARAPAERTVARRAWSDWDKVQLDLSDDENEKADLT